MAESDRVPSDEDDGGHVIARVLARGMPRPGSVANAARSAAYQARFVQLLSDEFVSDLSAKVPALEATTKQLADGIRDETGPDLGLTAANLGLVLARIIHEQ